MTILQRLALLLGLLAVAGAPLLAADISASNWAQVDASNNVAAPDGFPEGMAPSGVNDSARALMGGVKRWWVRSNATATTGGTATALTLTYAVAPGGLADGERYAFKLHAAIGAAATLNINSLGAKNLRKFDGSGWSNVAASDWPLGAVLDVVYNSAASTYDIINGSAPAGAVSATASNTFTGSNTFRNATTIFDLVDAGAGAGPNIRFFRDSVSPAANDQIGYLYWQGRDSAASVEDYALDAGYIITPTSGAEDGGLDRYVKVAGVQQLIQGWRAGSVFGSPAGLYKGVGTINVQSGIYDNNARVFANSLPTVQESFVATSSTTTSQIPNDDTIPQNTEGAEITTVNITTVGASDKTLCEIEVNAGIEGGTGEDDGFVVALFRDSGANALAAVAQSSFGNNAHTVPTRFSFLDTPGSAATFTYRVRIGPITGGATVRWNGASGGRKLGGVMRSGLRCMLQRA